MASVQDAYDDLRKRKTWEATLLLVFFAVGVAGVVFSLEPLWELAPAPVRWVLPVTLLWALLKVARWRYPERPRRPSTKQRSPASRQGLIVMLSPFGRNARGLASALGRDVTAADYDALRVPEKAEGVERLLDDPAVSAEALRTALLATNWGPLVVAVEHHRRTLQHVWVIATGGAGGSGRQAATARRLVERLVGGAARCHVPSGPADPLWVENPNDVTEVVEAVRYVIRRRLSAEGIERGEAIADLTSGLSTMTAGMILAALDAHRPLEYLRQDKPLFARTEAGADAPLAAQVRTLTPEEVVTQEALAEVLTSHRLVELPEDEAASP